MIPLVLPLPAVQVVVALGIVQLTAAALVPNAAVVFISDGQVMVIGLAILPAVTVTWKEQVSVLPQASVAE